MAWFARKRLLSLIFMAYTALSVLGTFSFATVEQFNSVRFEIDNKGHARISRSLGNYFIQHPAEELTINAESDYVKFSPVRMSFQRIASLSGLPISRKSCSASCYAVGTEIQHSDLKTNILLKLRI
jgi:hypothetical protein